MFDNRTYEIVIVAGIIRNALGTDKKLENCLYVGTATVSGDKTDNAKAYALTMQAAGYTVANNYIAAASAEDMTDDDVITVAVVCLNQNGSAALPVPPAKSLYDIVIFRSSPARFSDVSL